MVAAGWCVGFGGRVFHDVYGLYGMLIGLGRRLRGVFPCCAISVLRNGLFGCFAGRNYGQDSLRVLPQCRRSFRHA